MIFVGIALLVVAGLAFVVSTDAGALIGLTQTQTAQLIPLVVILIVFVGGALSRRPKASELVGGIMLWIGIFAAAGAAYAYRDELTGVADRMMGEFNPGIALIDEQRGTATFRRDSGGHFELIASVNGHATPMIFDTGASAVVLTSADAEAAGIDISNLRFTIPVSTANGTGQAARVSLDGIEVGGIKRKGIRAFVAEDGALNTSLLGMTYLETLSRYAVTSNSLELTD